MGNAFTVTYKQITQKLISEAVVEYNSKKMKVIAQWDTGATGTCISTSVVDTLEMIHSGFVRIQTPSGESVRKTYCIDLVLPNKITVKQLKVNDSEIGKQGIDILIGMDVISGGDFAVSNFMGKTVLSFRVPSEKRTDYVKEIAVTNTIGSKHGTGKRHKKK